MIEIIKNDRELCGIGGKFYYFLCMSRENECVGMNLNDDDCKRLCMSIVEYMCKYDDEYDSIKEHMICMGWGE